MKLVKKLLPVIDILIVPAAFIAAILLKFVRKAGLKNMAVCKFVFDRVGIFPITDHYYEPQFIFDRLNRPFTEDRSLNGINWNIDGQITFLEQLNYSSELDNIPLGYKDNFTFHLNNASFEVGDAEYWYQVIRKTRPTRIIEIGSGHSTLIARDAINKNRQDDANYLCWHVCIEPYEMPWLERAGVKVVRQKVEDLNIQFFSELQEGDILFIDSSHMIRPQGDVLFEFLELLPSLSRGVLVHVHDIFSPRNYPDQWLRKDVRFWNEQYLLEAFLTNNPDWEIVGALNYLQHHHFDALRRVCPNLSANNEPGSFYLRKLV